MNPLDLFTSGVYMWSDIYKKYTHTKVVFFSESLEWKLLFQLDLTLMLLVANLDNTK